MMTQIATVRAGGQEIFYEDGAFRRGQRTIMHHDIQSWDTQGALDWSTPEIREWFYSPEMLAHASAVYSAPLASRHIVSAVVTSVLVFLNATLIISVLSGRFVMTPYNAPLVIFATFGWVIPWLLSDRKFITPGRRGLWTSLFGLPVFVIVPLVLLVFVAGLTSNAPSPDITGHWATGDGSYMVIEEDGEFQILAGANAYTPATVISEGTYERDGDDALIFYPTTPGQYETRMEYQFTEDGSDVVFSTGTTDVHWERVDWGGE